MAGIESQYCARKHQAVSVQCKAYIVVAMRALAETNGQKFFPH